MENLDKQPRLGRTVLRSKRGSHVPLPPKAQVQRRRAERQPACKQITLSRIEGEVPGKPEQATLVDISTHGIGAIVTAPMKMGDEFSAQFHALGCSLMYRVKRCRPCGDISYKVGAEFIQRVSDDKTGSLENDVERIRRSILG